MKPQIPVSHIVLRDPRAEPGVLAKVIEAKEADVARRVEAVALLDARLGIEYAKGHLGMMSEPIPSIRDQLEAEIANLVIARRTLDGLRAIAAEQAARQNPARVGSA